MSLSIGIFFSLMIAGLASTLPKTLSKGLIAQGVPAAVANHVSHLPPVSTVFASLLGYNPVQNLLAPYGVLAKLPADKVALLTGRTFFPSLIEAPFHHGLVIVFTAAAIMAVTGALVSLTRGKQFYYDDNVALAPVVPAVRLESVTSKTSIMPNGHGRARSANGFPGGADDNNGAVPGRDSASPRRGGSA
jgi:hypothetical protein